MEVFIIDNIEAKNEGKDGSDLGKIYVNGR